MKVDAYKCDFCEEFTNDFVVENDWFVISNGANVFHLCSIVCMINWAENDSWRIP